jgi:hypothetical protein
MIKGWSFAKIITLPIPDAALTDFPVCVKIVADTDIGGGCLASGYDIRFTAADSITLLPYERESFAVASGEATGIFWVKTNVATAGTSVWVYYGNLSATDVSDPENVWDTNFKAVYHMNDATTSTILDSTANDNDGAKKAANEPIEANAKIWKGQDFAGDDDYIDCGATADCNFSKTDPFSVELWVFPDTSVGGRQFVSRVNSGDTGGWSFVYNDGLLAIVLVDNLGTSYLIYKAIDLTDGWHLVGETFSGNGNTSGLKLYIDGAEVVPDAVIGGAIAGEITVAISLFLGRWAQAGNFYYDGLMDEVRISSLDRSAEWIAYEYANMNPADGGLTWGAEKNVKSAVHSFFES